MKLKNIILTTLAAIALISCYTSSRISKFSSENIKLGIDHHRLKILIDRFVMKVFNGVQNTATHYDKINTYNEIIKNRMTIKVLFKYFRIIDVKKVTISVTVVTRRDVTVTVEEEVNFFAVDSGVKEKTDE